MSIRVLLVEDDKTFLEVVKQVVNKLGPDIELRVALSKGAL